MNISMKKILKTFCQILEISHWAPETSCSTLEILCQIIEVSHLTLDSQILMLNPQEVTLGPRGLLSDL